MRVLIIDDEEDTRSIFSMSLGLLGGAEVIEAGNGPAGIQLAAQENPDVIILDLLMPGMDGSQTFLALKDKAETCKIPVIFMTVKGMFSEFDTLKNMGALAVIAKPFDPTTLTQQIKSILTTNGFHPESGNSFASELNKIDDEIDPSASASEMINSDKTENSSGVVALAPDETKRAIGVPTVKKSGAPGRSKTVKQVRTAERIIAKNRPKGR